MIIKMMFIISCLSGTCYLKKDARNSNGFISITKNGTGDYNIKLSREVDVCNIADISPYNAIIAVSGPDGINIQSNIHFNNKLGPRVDSDFTLICHKQLNGD